MTQEIVELIDREADLLMRGTKESNLEGLRKRISTLFLQYIKTPTFNAEAARLLKVSANQHLLFFVYFHWLKRSYMFNGLNYEKFLFEYILLCSHLKKCRLLV